MFHEYSIGIFAQLFKSDAIVEGDNIRFDYVFKDKKIYIQGISKLIRRKEMAANKFLNFIFGLLLIIGGAGYWFDFGFGLYLWSPFLALMVGIFIWMASGGNGWFRLFSIITIAISIIQIAGILGWGFGLSLGSYFSVGIILIGLVLILLATRSGTADRGQLATGS